MKEKKVQRIFTTKHSGPLEIEVYDIMALFNDNKIYKWDWTTGDWLPYWNQETTSESTPF